MTKASIQAVAREAGVSVSTVSRTFAKPDLVLPETRDRVMAAAEKLDYSVSRSAAALKSGQSFRIALLASETIASWFNSNIFAGLDSALRPSGYDTVPYPMRNAAERHDFFADLPVRRNADAVIVSSFDIEPAEVERLKHMHVPIVGINIPSTDGFDAGVSIDDYAATRSAIEHLIALGHRHIAFVGSAPTETNMRYSAEAGPDCDLPRSSLPLFCKGVAPAGFLGHPTADGALRYAVPPGYRTDGSRRQHGHQHLGPHLRRVLPPPPGSLHRVFAIPAPCHALPPLCGSSLPVYRRRKNKTTADI